MRETLKQLSIAELPLPPEFVASEVLAEIGNWHYLPDDAELRLSVGARRLLDRAGCHDGAALERSIADADLARAISLLPEWKTDGAGDFEAVINGFDLAFRWQVDDDGSIRGIVSETSGASRQLDRLLSDCTDGVLLLSDDGVVVDVNRHALGFFGYEHSDMVGKRVDDIFTETGLRTYSRLLESFRNRGDRILMHARVLEAICADGRHIRVEVSLLSRDGNRGVYCLVRDVTTRDTLRDKRLKEFLDILPFPILIYQRHRVPEFVNKDAMRRLGVAEKQEIADFSIRSEGGGDTGQGLNAIRQAFETGQVQMASRLEWVLRNGRSIPFNLLVRPFEVDENAEVQRVIAVISDMSDLKQRQLANHRRAEAEAASRAKSKFLANISHEIRTPLNAMLGFQQLVLQKDELSPMDRKNIEMSLQAGVGLLDLLNNIIDIARIDSGAIEVDEVEFEAESLRRGIEEQFDERAREAGLRFSVRLMENCPATLVSDEDKIRQILVHLVNNALQFTSEGEVSVVIARQSGHLLLEVSDTGPGIDEKRLEVLFEPFQPLDHENGEAEGSGLGLAICKSFVDALGGTIEVETEVRKGACFKILIPVSGFAEEAKEAEKAAGNVRVLVVDDSDSNRQLLNQLLTRVGYEFYEAEDGLEGIEVAMQCQPHVVLMDLQMPRMDGYQAAREIKSRLNTRIIAVSANVFDGDIKRAEEAGIDGFVKKPFRLGMILDVIEKNFEEEAAASEAPGEFSLDSLTVTQRQDLRDSLMRADPLEFKRLLGSYSTIDRAAAGELSSMVERYRYQEVIDLLGH